MSLDNFFHRTLADSARIIIIALSDAVCEDRLNGHCPLDEASRYAWGSGERASLIYLNIFKNPSCPSFCSLSIAFGGKILSPYGRPDLL
jgi:hypothetical protein